MVPRLYMLMVPHFKSGNTVIPHVHKYDSHLPNLESVWREPATRNNFNWSEKKRVDVKNHQWLSSEAIWSPKNSGLSKLKNNWSHHYKHQVPHEISWGTGGKPIFIYPLDSWLQIHTCPYISPYTVAYPCGSMANTPSPSPLPIPTYFMLVGQSIN